MKKKAFSLGEVIVTVIIISILASIALGNYYVTTVRAREKEAHALLRLIQHAEEVRMVEVNNYIDCGDTATCNTNLHLNLPTTSWAYSVAVNGATFCATAVRSGANTFHIRNGEADPSGGGC
jgi:prepilin-type N-terminal cleavage/methylation domain-containing protein